MQNKITNRNIFLLVLIALFGFIGALLLQTRQFKDDHRPLSGPLKFYSCAFSGCNPLKATDPADPRFNPLNFSFRDYPATPFMRDVLRKLFPIGTNRKFVDQVLITSGHASTHPGETPNSIVYFAPSSPLTMEEWSQTVVVIYDENDRVKKVIFNSYDVNKPLVGGKSE